MQTRFTDLCLRKEILATDDDFKVKSLQEENESLKIEIESLKSHESSCGGHKQHDPEMEKSLEFVGAEYAYLKGLYVAAKKDLKALDERLTFPSAQVDEMTIEIDNLVQQRYNFNFKLAGVPEIAEPRSKESALDTTKLCVRIFEAMGFNKCEVIYGKGKGKVTLFNVGSSFSYETGINGSRRCALYPPASVSAPFYGYSKVWLHGSEESGSRR